MPQLSSIEQLPDDQQKRIKELCADRRQTLDKLVERLQAEMGEDAPSRSALGRYRKVTSFMRSSREMCELMRAELGDLSDDEQSRLNYEMLQEQIFRVQMASLGDDENKQASVKDLRSLADAMYRLAASRKQDADRIIKIKQETAKETAEKAAKVVDAVAANTPGLSKATVDDIKRRILGIAA